MIKNNKKTMKTLVFSLGLVAMLLTSTNLNAQDRGLFGKGKSSTGYEKIGNRDGVGISNQTFELETGGTATPTEAVPLGSGLLILTAAGAGYAIARRKRNLKQGATLLLAFALLLGMTNCKKSDETITPTTTDTVQITLTVENGSKVDINTGTGVVTFGTGDIIYVGNNGKYCGYLVHDGEKFAGGIAPTSTDDYLHFYFVGNKLPDDDPSFDLDNDFEPNTTSFDISISDQSSGLPLISYAPSTEKYTVGVTSYTAMLRNYCSLVKFNTNGRSIPTGGRVFIEHSSIKDQVTVNFSHTLSKGEPYSFDDYNHNIYLNVESDNICWAVLLEQEAIDDVEVSIYEEDGNYAVYLGDIDLPEIEKNHLYTNKGSGYYFNLLMLLYIDYYPFVFDNNHNDETWEYAIANYGFNGENDWEIGSDNYVYCDGKKLYGRKGFLSGPVTSSAAINNPGWEYYLE